MIPRLPRLAVVTLPPRPNRGPETVPEPALNLVLVLGLTVGIAIAIGIVFMRRRRRKPATQISNPSQPSEGLTQADHPHTLNGSPSWTWQLRELVVDHFGPAAAAWTTHELKGRQRQIEEWLGPTHSASLIDLHELADRVKFASAELVEPEQEAVTEILHNLQSACRTGRVPIPTTRTTGR